MRIDQTQRVSLYVLLVFLLALPIYGGELSRDGVGNAVDRIKGEAIPSGFVFVDGRYIEAPYVVSRSNSEVSVNNVVVRKLDPVPAPDVPREDPGPPIELTEESTLNHLKHSAGVLKKFRYLHHRFSEDTAMRKMAEYYKDIPCVAEVSLKEPDNFRFLEITLKNGECGNIDVSGPSPGSVSSEGLSERKVASRLDRYRHRLENRLEKGDCFFLFSRGGELSFGKRKAAKDLKLIVDILRSDRDVRQKTSLLEKLSVLPPKSSPSFSKLITNFHASPQLDQRVDQLITELGVSPTTYSAIPEETEAERKERILKERQR